MFEGSYKYIQQRDVPTKTGSFKVATFGDPTKCTQFELIVPKEVTLPEKVEVPVKIKVDLEQRGFKLQGILRSWS